MLVADNICLTLSGRDILHDFSTQIESGRVTIILGPNGAGKSSLLACLSGLLKVDSGHVIIEGRDIGKLRDKQRACKIGLLPQSGDVHWDILVRDLVALGRLPHQRSHGLIFDDTEAINSAMIATDTLCFANRNIRSLSGGERARVLLARVLAGKPDWLLADEPLANLDPAHQIAMLSLLKHQAVDGAGVVAVLHDLNHAARIADHILLMDRGKLVASGTPSDVLNVANLANVYGINCFITRDDQGSPIITIIDRSN